MPAFARAVAAAVAVVVVVVEAADVVVVVVVVEAAEAAVAAAARREAETEPRARTPLCLLGMCGRFRCDRLHPHVRLRVPPTPSRKE